MYTSSNNKVARYFIEQINKPPQWAQTLNVVGEAGEFAEAYRRYTGNARRSSDIDEVMLELADVVIAAYVWAEFAGLSLDAYIAQKWAIIFKRGYGNQAKDPENNP